MSIALFDASDLNVTYAGTSHDLSIGEISRAKQPSEDMHPRFTYGVYFAFAGVVDVHWRSLGGELLSTSLDLDKIFKTRKIIYSADSNSVYQAKPIARSHPTIVVEVDNRKITVYMHVGINFSSPNLHTEYFTTAVFSDLL